MNHSIQTHNKKVFIGLSGGVDSSVSAYLLKQAGYDVTGVFLKVWQPDFMYCTAKEDRRDAMRVAASLSIPFMTIDAVSEYKQYVVDYMIAEYKRGRTPNPDVMCNSVVKFGVFYKKARELGADFIATGHYAQRIEKEGEVLLGEAIDTTKDQTYFLWNIPREALKHSLFPVGGYHKKDIREIARKAGLYTAEKKDSQGLCFIGKVSMQDFLSHFLDLQPGKVLDIKGSVIGHHNGALLYTVGQRHNFTITEKGTDDTPLYVVSTDIDTNTIVVDTKNDTQDTSTAMITQVDIGSTNWLGKTPVVGDGYMARMRYRQALVPCVCTDMREGHAVVQFSTSHLYIACGQSLVLYKDGTCLGGGIIEHTYE